MECGQKCDIPVLLWAIEPPTGCPILPPLTCLPEVEDCMDDTEAPGRAELQVKGI